VNEAEVVDVLTKCAAFDQRTVGETDVLAWHEVLGSLEIRDCLDAVTTHYTHESKRAMPADIRTLALVIRDERKSKQRVLERRLSIESGPTTTDRSDEVTALVQSVVDSLPRADIQEKAIARARRERGHVKPDVKPRRRNKPPKDYPDPATEDAAALARQYLRDGYAPAEVSERLAISKRWCERTARRFSPPEAS
jgi:hypothetical protein